MFERTVSCSSLSKTYSITGWRLGYVVAPPAFIDGARKVHDFLTVGAARALAGGRHRRSGNAGRLLRPSGGNLRGQARPLPRRPARRGLTFTEPEGAY